MASESFTVEIEQQEDFRFAVHFTEGPGLVTDEPEPTGGGRGPDAGELLAAAVANCLTASLLFCLRKARVASGPVRAQARGRVARNREGRLRIAELTVTITAPGATERCLNLFEDYCTVTQSVRDGIPVTVVVTDGAGSVLHRHDPGQAPSR